MPDNSSLLTFPVVAAAAASTSYGAVEVPYNADIVDVTAVCTAAPAGGALQLDIIKVATGVSIFAAPIAAIAARSAVKIGDTVLYLEFTGNQAVDLQPGASFIVDSETFFIAPQTTSGTGLVQGGIQGSSKVDGGQPVYAVTVTVAATAVHAVGASVYPAKPTLAVSSKESSLTENPAWNQLVAAATGLGFNSAPSVVEGDVLQLTTLASAGYTGASAVNVEVSVELVER